MAITEAALTSGSDTTTGTSATTASVSPTANRLVLVAVCNTANTGGNRAAPSGISGAGYTFDKIAEALVETDFTQVSLWRGLLASPSSGALTISFVNSMDLIVWSVFELDGIDTGGTNGSAAIVQSATNSTTGTTQTVTLAAFGSADNGAVSVHGWDSASTSTPATATAGTGFTEIHDGGATQGSGFAIALQSQWRADNDTTANITWSTTGSLGGIAVEIKAAGAAATTRQYRLTTMGCS